MDRGCSSGVVESSHLVIEHDTRLRCLPRTSTFKQLTPTLVGTSKGPKQMAGRSDAARAALRNVAMLHEDFHAPILHALSNQGLLDSAEGGNGGEIRAKSFTDARRNAVVTMVQAATGDPRNAEMLRQIRANARRLNVGELFEDGTKPIDLNALNKGLANAPTVDRWRFRDMLYSLRLIPA